MFFDSLKKSRPYSRFFPSDDDRGRRALGDGDFLDIGHMGVHIGRGGDVRVPEPLLDLLERKALLQQQGRDRVAQVVEPDARQRRPPADPLKLARDVVRPAGASRPSWQQT